VMEEINNCRAHHLGPRMWIDPLNGVVDSNCKDSWNVKFIRGKDPPFSLPEDANPAHSGHPWRRLADHLKTNLPLRSQRVIT
jgi:hypothetical protein